MKKSIFGCEEQRFGIRKYSVGVASVLIASVLVMGGQTVAADDVVSADAISTELVTDVQEESENSSAISESNVQADVTTEDENTEAVTSDETDEQAVSQVANENQPEETADVAKEEQVEESNATETSEAREVESNQNEVVTINVAQVSKNVQTNQARVFEESKIPVTANSLPNQGYYTYTKQTEVKNTPKASAPVAFYANVGDRIFYDQVLSEDGYQWISYKSYSGQRRYAAIQKLTPTVVQKLSGSINIQNVSSQGFEVLVTNVSDPEGVKAVKVPVWTDKNDQDDIIWYDGVKQTNGDYKVIVKTAEHKGETGNYNVHLYYLEQSGKMRGVLGTKTTVAEAKLSGQLAITNQSPQGFDVIISEVSNPNGVKTVKVPVWSTQGGQDDIIWYNATKQNDGTYKVAVNVKDHKNNSGEYNVHLYYEQNDGSLKGVSATRTTVEAPKAQPAPDMPQSGTYVFTSPKEVKSQPKVSAPTEFTLDKGYQIHYDQAFSADGHQWISYVSYGGLRRYVLIN